MKLAKLFKRTKLGQIQTWEIEVIAGQYRTIEGILDGKITTNVFTTCLGKNIGKANETSPADQALKEAKAKAKKKQEEGYTTDVTATDEAAVIEPMLAHNLEDYPIEVWPVLAQRKLDGVRARIRKDGVFSRKNKEFLSCPHIMEALEEVLAKLPDDIFLDGELYCEELHDDFEELISIIKQSKPTAEDKAKSKKYIKFYCYDVSFKDRNYVDRLTFLQETLEGIEFVVVVDTYIVADMEELNRYHKTFVHEGYEGLMVRHNTPYVYGRTKNLLKKKDWITEEFEVVDVLSGKGIKADQAARLLLKKADGTTFKGTPKVSHEVCKRWLKEKKQIIGEMATLKFFSYTKAGIPRFPNVLTIRNYE